MYSNFILKYISFLTPEHIKNYTLRRNISISDSEVLIIYNFIKDNYKELLKGEDVLIKLKPLISNDLYLKVVDEYKKNKTLL